jgi:hypothetical protein
MSNETTIRLPVVILDEDEKSPLMITYKHPRKLRNAVETIAYYFRREMHYDLVQYESVEKPSDPYFVYYEAYLFFEEALDLVFDYVSPIKSRIIGACCFRKRFKENWDYCWSLDWIWLHPYYRHQRKLTDAWQLFNRKYQYFHVEPPYSIEMEKFLSKVGWIDDPEKYTIKYKKPEPLF